MSISAIRLSGSHVQLEPLTNEHLTAIQSAANDGELWKLFFTTVPSTANTQQWLDTALEMQRQEKAIPFAYAACLAEKL